MPSPLRFLLLILLLLTGLVPHWSAAAETAKSAALTASEAVTDSTAAGRTGLRLPRFAALRSPLVNLRTGPGLRYPIDWVYKRRGLPVVILDEFGTWRQIRDWQGTLGWVHQSMLHGKRGILITGRERMLRKRPRPEAAAIARVEAGVVGALKHCDGGWCRIGIGDYEGWLARDEFYGLLPDERLD